MQHTNAYDVEYLGFDEEITLSEDAEQCPQCGQLNEPIGTLGNLAHLRCQNCGWQYSRDTRQVIK